MFAATRHFYAQWMRRTLLFVIAALLIVGTIGWHAGYRITIQPDNLLDHQRMHKIYDSAWSRSDWSGSRYCRLALCNPEPGIINPINLNCLPDDLMSNGTVALSDDWTVYRFGQVYVGNRMALHLLNCSETERRKRLMIALDAVRKDICK